MSNQIFSPTKETRTKMFRGQINLMPGDTGYIPGVGFRVITASFYDPAEDQTKLVWMAEGEN